MYSEGHKDVLGRLARDNGRKWKHRLKLAWITGNYEKYLKVSVDIIPVLQEIRNTYPIEELDKYIA